MRYFFYDGNLTENKQITLDALESNHITRVLRLKEQDIIFILNGAGQGAEAEIISIGKKFVTVHTTNVLTKNKAPPHFILCQASLKSLKMDWLIEKAAELGVDEIQIFPSKYSQSFSAKEDRYKKITISACKQAENYFLPKITIFKSLSEILVQSDSNIKIILEPSSTTGLLPFLQKSSLKNIAKIFLLVGPEGGFTKDEIGLAVNAGFQSIALGPNILRGETAGIVSSALCRHFIDFSPL